MPMDLLDSLDHEMARRSPADHVHGWSGSVFNRMSFSSPRYVRIDKTGRVGHGQSVCSRIATAWQHETGIAGG